MYIHELLVVAPNKRLDRLARPLAEGCLPWLVSRIKPANRGERESHRRGYIRAWAGLAVREMANNERLPGLGAHERELAVVRAVDLAVDEVLRWVPPRAALPLRKAA